MKLNQHVTFMLNKKTCPPVKINNNYLPQADEVKYLGIHLNRRLTCRKHITAKRKQLELRLRNLYWILGRQSQLTLNNKILVYKAISKPVWTYGVQLWGTASNSNLEILERFQSKVLRIITDAPWCVPNAVIKRDLQISTVTQEAKRYSAIYSKRIGEYPNTLAHTLFQEQPKPRRLRRLFPTDLS
jgi:hypothetical protein